ncbi:methyltransferase domain-containing protein [Lysobacter sp. P5_B9]
MKDDLTSIPFDHYQRYATGAAIVQSLEPGAGTVLEVGANRQRLLGAFLPNARVLYTDIEAQEADADFVVADATALPFADHAFDAVISLDVLEHIAPAARASAVAEMARVAGRLVVIGCPIDQPVTRAVERDADSVWREYFKESYPWLEEHQVYGLVDPIQVEAGLKDGGLRVFRFGQGDAGLWAALMGAHFAKEAVPELAGVVAAMDRCYNSCVFPFDWEGDAYRQFFVGVRHAADEVHVAHPALPPAETAREGASGLKAIAAALHPIASRVLTAEREWTSTADALRNMSESAAEQLRRADASDRRAAELHGERDQALAGFERAIAQQHDVEARLQQEALAHHETGLKLQEQAHSAVEQFHRAEAADQKAEAADRKALEHFHRAEAADRKALEHFHRAEAADRKALGLATELAQSNDDLASLRVAHVRLEADRLRLHERTRVLERRQRWALYATAVAVVAGLLFAVIRSYS